jgi:uncharacterized membrane protein YfhO
LEKTKLKFHWKKGTSDDTGLKEISPNSNRFLKYIEANPLLVLILFISAIGFFIFKDYLLFRKFYIFKDIGSDTYNQAYPFYVHMSNYLRSDGIPRWSFNVGMGQNIFPGCFIEPFNLIISLFKPEQIPYAIVYLEFLKIFTGGLLAFGYLRTLGSTKYTAITGAAIFAFCGFMILGSEWYDFSSISVYIMFFLFSFERLLVKKKLILFPLSVALLSIFSFTTYTFCWFLVFYIPFRYIEVYGWNFKQFLLFMLKLFGLGIIGVMISSLFIFNTILRVLDSPRVGGESGYFNKLRAIPLFQFADKHQMVTAFYRLFSNDMLGAGNNFRGWYNYLEAPVFYCSLFSLVLIPQLFRHLKNNLKVLYGFWLFIFVLVVVFPFFRHTINLYAGDYYKVSISFIVSLILFYFAVRAFDYTYRKGKTNRIVLIITLVFLIILLFIPFFPAKLQMVDARLHWFVIGFIGIYAIILWFSSYLNKNIWLKLILMLVIGAELIVLSYNGVNNRMAFTPKEFKQKTGYNDYSVEALKYIKENDKGFYRINKDYFSGTAIHSALNEAHIQDFYGTSSYMSFNQGWYIHFLGATNVIDPRNETSTRWSIGLITHPLLQTFGSVKYNLSKNGGTQYENFGYKKIGVFGDVSLMQNELYLPLGFTYDRYILYSDYMNLPVFFKEIALVKGFVIDDNMAGNFQKLACYHPWIENLTTAEYNLNKFANDVNQRQNGAMKLTRHSQNHISGTVNIDKPKLLFFSIPYDKGWKIIVDGKPQLLSRVNIGFMGIVLDSGQHSIELKFRPRFQTISLFTTLFGLFLLFLIKYSRSIKKFFRFNDPVK